MRVRLYWSMARLAHAEGRESVALTNVRKAIALLQATDDTFHLARAHILAAVHHALARRSGRRRAAPRPGGAAARRVADAAGLVEITMQRARVAALRGEARDGRHARARARSSSARRRIAGRRGPRAARARRRSGADRRATRRRRRRTAEAVDLLERAGPLALTQQPLPRLGRMLATSRPRGRGARRARPRCRARHARGARQRARRALTRRARGHDRAGPYSLALLGTILERRDTHVPRRALHRAARRRRPAASSRAPGSRPDGTVTIRRESRGGRRAAALDPRARRRPLDFLRARARRPDARACVAAASRPAARARARPSRRRCCARSAAS